MHTTVIRAADQREVGNLVRIRAPKSTDAANFAEMLRFQHFYRPHGSGTRFFTKSLKRRAPTAVARRVCAEMLASETPERRRSTFLKNACFCALVRLDFNRSGVGRLDTFPIRICYLEYACFLSRWEARF